MLWGSPASSDCPKHPAHELPLVPSCPTVPRLSSPSTVGHNGGKGQWVEILRQQQVHRPGLDAGRLPMAEEKPCNCDAHPQHSLLAGAQHGSVGQGTGDRSRLATQSSSSTTRGRHRVFEAQ